MIVARTLGVEGKGIYALVLMVGALLVLFLSFGLGNSITYFTASRQYPIRDLFSFSVAATIFFSVIGGVVFYISYKLFLSNRVLAGVSSTHIQLILISIPISLLTIYLTSIVHGKQEFLAYNVITVTRVYSNLLLQIVSTLLSGGILGAILAWVIASIISLGTALWYVREDISLVIRFPIAMLKPLASFGFKNYITNLLSFFNLRLDTFFVNYYSGSGMVGLYSTGVSSAELVWYVPNAIGSALYPKSSTMSKDASARVTAQICRQVLVVTTILVIGASVLGPFLIPFFYGSDFQASVQPFLWLLPGILGISVSKIIASNLGGIGKPQFAAYTSIITLAATIVLDIILIPVYSIVGAAIASSVAYLLSTSVLVYWFSKDTKVKISEVTIPRWRDMTILINSTGQLWRQVRTTIL